ncbi:MAG: phosphate ABC transporter permease subunit PstC [Pyrobaculum sp.]
MLGLIILLSLIFYIFSIIVLVFIKFRIGMKLIGAVSILIIGGMAVVFLIFSLPAFEEFGVGIFFSTEWDPGAERYGLANAITGTLLTSAIAIAIAVPIALGIVVFINEILPRRLAGIFGSLVDLTAALPTVLFGLWGLFVLGPALAWAVESFSNVLLQLGLISEPLYTTRTSLLTASVLLAIMIVPYAAAVIREGYALVPKHVEEAIYAMGATKFEAVLIKFRYIRNYLFGGFFLALGRAMGETVAVAMVVGGNYYTFTINPLDSGITLSSLIALQFPNAFGILVPVLYAAALTIALIGIIINTVAIYILYRGQL